MNKNTKVVVDDTTIYEVDLDCYRCLKGQEQRRPIPERTLREEAERERETPYSDM